MFLDYFALFMTFFVSIFIFYSIIAIHDIPYEIARKRNHPHQDAINVAGWVSLFTLHVLWPFLWIWSTLYREDQGWGFNTDNTADVGTRADVSEIQKKIDELAAKVESMQIAMDEKNKKAEG